MKMMILKDNKFSMIQTVYSGLMNDELDNWLDGSEPLMCGIELKYFLLLCNGVARYRMTLHSSPQQST